MKISINLCIFAVLTVVAFVACKDKCAMSSTPITTDGHLWKEQVRNTLPMLGHRNWIIVADKAFPMQNAEGMQYVNADEKLLPVLQHVLQSIDSSTHVKPIIYRDKELQYITDSLAEGMSAFVKEQDQILTNRPVQTLLHDEVFPKLDNASKLFKVLVIKTNETLPYTSVFIELDCKYWNAEKEAQLRKNLEK